MSVRLGPCKRDDFIRALRVLGFQGPASGRRHEFMQYRDYPLSIPSYEEYGVDKLKEMIREVGNLVGHPISNQDWANIRRGNKPSWLGD